RRADGGRAPPERSRAARRARGHESDGPRTTRRAPRHRCSRRLPKPCRAAQTRADRAPVRSGCGLGREPSHDGQITTKDTKDTKGQSTSRSHRTCGTCREKHICVLSGFCVSWYASFVSLVSFVVQRPCHGALYSAVTTVLIPPRTEKSPTTVMRRG